MKKCIILLFLGLALTAHAENRQGQNHVDSLIAQLNNPQSNYVMVAAHRGDWRNYADNSLEGILSCVRMGVDIIEIDVAMTADSVLILMHDKTVDRTTNGTGKVAELTYDYISGLKLKNGLGRPSAVFTVPTLYEVMCAIKGKALINIDKADRYFDQVYHVLEQTGTLDQVIIKSSKPYTELHARFGDRMDKMIFMPVINLPKESPYTEADNFVAFEIVVPSVDDVEKAKEFHQKIRGKSKMWINTLWDDLAGGYTDDRALTDPDGAWGFWVDHGATMLQTDRPEALINYLSQRGLRK